jgi:GxxExxY protein
MIENIKDPRAHTIIGAAMEVHTNMGSGLLEAVYQECMEIELKLRKIQFISQPRIKIYYRAPLLSNKSLLLYLKSGAYAGEC